MARKSVEAPTILSVDKPKSSGTVTVACKIPQGIRLQLQHDMEAPVPTGMGEVQMVKRRVFGGPVYHVFGPSMPAMGGVPDGYVLPKSLEGGYALTEGIPAAFWEKWLEQNKLADYVTNRMIFAYDRASAKDAAREHGELRSGLEPLSRDMDNSGRLKDRRVPKPLTSSLGRIAFDTERDAERRGASAAE